MILLPLFGMWGAVATILISQMVTFVVFALLFWKAKA